MLLPQIRSQDYMRSKQKQASSKAIYRLVGMDLFSSESKAYHVAKQFALPATGICGFGLCASFGLQSMHMSLNLHLVQKCAESCAACAREAAGACCR